MSVASEVRQAILDETGECCEECGGTAIRRNLHLHHIVPIDQGGTDDRSNLICLCASCHLSSSKYHGRPDDWRAPKAIYLSGEYEQALQTARRFAKAINMTVSDYVGIAISERNARLRHRLPDAD